MRESRARTIVRTLTWRVGGVVLGVLLGWAFTGDWRLGAELGLAYNAIRLATHYLHERAWLRTRWGLVPADREVSWPPDYPCDNPRDMWRGTITARSGERHQLVGGGRGSIGTPQKLCPAGHILGTADADNYCATCCIGYVWAGSLGGSRRG